MAKKALVIKQQAKPKFKVRGYTRCRRCGRPRSLYPPFGLCPICAREMVHARQGSGVTQGSSPAHRVSGPAGRRASAAWPARSCGRCGDGMSGIGKKPIPTPSGVEVTIDGRRVVVKGPNGQLEHEAPEDIIVSRDGDELIVTRPDDEREHRALHGLTRSLVANMVTGVSQGFVRELEIVGVGYRAASSSPSRL